MGFMMDRLPVSKLILFFLFMMGSLQAFPPAEESFILIDGATGEILQEHGPHLHERVTPCCTFNIFLSLIGFDAGILKDGNAPVWDFQEGFDDYLESWKAPQTPLSWMTHSCLWYTKALARELGLEKIQDYLALLDYGNQDMSGGLTAPAWLSSSLEISPKEQVDFMRRMHGGMLQISTDALEWTKVLLFKEELPEGWKLYGKTGLGTIKEKNAEDLEVVWFVGWIEKDQSFFPFAYSKREKKITRGQSILRVKQLLDEI